MRGEVARLPVVVKRVVADLIVPQRARSGREKLTQRAERSLLEEPLVAVVRAVLERHPLARLGRRVVLRAERTVERKVRRQHERAAVVGVVALAEQINHRRLGRGGLDGGVRVDDARRRVEARIRDAPDADASVVVGDVVDQPIDGVVHVRARIDIGGRFLLVEVRGHLDEFALGLEAPAHVLVDEDVARLVEILGGSEVARGRREMVLAVGVLAVARVGDAHAVGRADHQERVRLRLVLGHVDGGEEFHAVAHGDAVFVLRVMLAHVEGRFVRFFLGRRRGGRTVRGLGRDGAREQNEADRREAQRKLHGKEETWKGGVVEYSGLM